MNSLTHVSDSAKNLLGFSPVEWMEEPFVWEKHVHPDDLKVAAMRFRRAPNLGKAYESTYRMLNRANEAVWIHEVATALTSPDNRRLMRGLMVDVANLKEAEAKGAAASVRLSESLSEREQALVGAEAASRAKSSFFLAVMSHELRTPLNAIIGFSEMMQREIMGPVNNDSYRSYVNSIHQAAALLLGIINSILDLSRVESGKAKLDIKRTNLIRVRETVSTTLHANAISKGVGLKFVGMGASEFLADVEAAGQILLNFQTRSSSRRRVESSSWAKENQMGAKSSSSCEIQAAASRATESKTFWNHSYSFPTLTPGM